MNKPPDWHLIATLGSGAIGTPVDVPVESRVHLYSRIGELVLSEDITKIEVYRYGQLYRVLTIDSASQAKKQALFGQRSP